MSQRKSSPALIPAAGAILLLLAACSSSKAPPEPPGIYKVGNPYQIAGRWYHPSFDPGYDRIGVASWYGDEFHGRPTANGEVFDTARLTAAHPTMPLPSIVRITNLANDRTLDLRVNDRGPFIGDRIIDVSQAAARELGFEHQGTTPVRVRFLQLADARGVPPQPSSPVMAAVPPAVSDVQLVAAVPGASCVPAGRFIQVGAFSEPERAERVAREVETALLTPVATHPPTVDRLVRVRLGPVAGPELAPALSRLSQIGYGNAFVVHAQDQPWQSC